MGWDGNALATSCVLLFACGPSAGDPGEGQSGGDDTGDPESSADDASSGAPLTTDGVDESSGGDDDDTATPAACSEPSVPDVMLEVLGPGDGYAQRSCGITALELGDVTDTIELACLHKNGGLAMAMAITFGNAAVLAPTAIEIGDTVELDYASAAAEYSGQWLTLRDPEGRLLLGVAVGDSALPMVEGAPSDFFAPLLVDVLDDRCAPGPGNCFELGEPTVLRFVLPDEEVEIEPFQVGSLGDFTIHTGDSWLSDPESAYSCDGPTDDRARFIVAVP